MYKEHDSFSPPKEDQKIWRYQNTDKFLHLITSQCLYFSPSDQLDDPMEGSYTAKDKEWLKDLPQKTKDDLSRHGKSSKPFALINCWHMADEETMSMWRSYTERGQGIVIQSSFKSFKNALVNTSDDILIGMVKYTDHSSLFEDGDFTMGNDFNRFLLKDKSYSYEEELRAMKYSPSVVNKGFDYKNRPTPEDCYVKVDLEILIESIIVSPTMPLWILESLQKITQANLPKTRVSESTLKRQPIFSFN